MGVLARIVLVVSACVVAILPLYTIFQSEFHHMVLVGHDSVRSELEQETAGATDTVRYTNLDPLVLVASFGISSCDQISFTFVREFYFPSAEPLGRFHEILNATRLTIGHNPCGKYKLLLGDPGYADHLGALYEQYPNVLIEAWWAPGGVTFSRIILAAKQSGTPFVLSTADTIIGPIGKLHSICSKAFTEANLMVVSRRDVVGGLDCNFYKSQGSWDVFIGTTASMISDDAILNSVFLPQYWGVENVMAFLLSGREPSNLCGLVDVVHLHKVRTPNANIGGSRIRINNGGNSIASSGGSLQAYCDPTRLEELKVKAY